MGKVWTLTWREIHSVFFSPLAYIVLTVFLFFSGLGFALKTTEASMSGTIAALLFLFLVATPFLTMRLLAEESRSGTIETLMTAPVTETAVILSKFLGTLVFFAFMLLPTLGYVVILCVLGEPDLGPIVSAYIGLLLTGAHFIAIGLFCSALTRSQVVAGVTALIILLTLWGLGEVAASMGGSFEPIVSYLGTWQHLRPFAYGRITFRDTFFFLSSAAFWLFLSVRVLESRRWR